MEAAGFDVFAKLSGARNKQWPRVHNNDIRDERAQFSLFVSDLLEHAHEIGLQLLHPKATVATLFSWTNDRFRRQRLFEESQRKLA